MEVNYKPVYKSSAWILMAAPPRYGYDSQVWFKDWVKDIETPRKTLLQSASDFCSVHKLLLVFLY